MTKTKIYQDRDRKTWTVELASFGFGLNIVQAFTGLPSHRAAITYLKRIGKL